MPPKPREQIDVGSLKKQLHELLEQDVSSYERKGCKDFQALQNGLINSEQHIFTFLEQEGVPHHNNSGEGAIRILKVKSKISGGFRTEVGADEYACCHSIVETAKRNGVSKFKALFQLISDMAPKDDLIGRLLSEND